MNPSERYEAQFDETHQACVKLLVRLGYGRRSANEIQHEVGHTVEGLQRWNELYDKGSESERRRITTAVAAFTDPSELPPPPPVGDARDRPVYVDEIEPEPDRAAPATPEQAAEFRRELIKRLKGFGGAS